MVACPKLVKFYNMHTGGIDLLDFILGYCRIRIRSKKWYHWFFFHRLDLSIVNTWLLWMRKTNSDLLLLEFKLGIADKLCMVGKSLQTRGKGHWWRREYTNLEERLCLMMMFVRTMWVTYHYEMTSAIGARENDMSFSFIKCEKCKVSLCLIRTETVSDIFILYNALICKE